MRKFLCTFFVFTFFRAYPWVLEYINRYSRHKARNITATSAIRQTESGKISTSFYLLPGHGTHYLNYRSRFIQVERQREKHAFQRNGIRIPLETVTLTTLGK
jgi:chaperone BCS1